MDQKPILVLDFDGVIHSYKSGWKGPTIVPDPPIEGAIEFIEQALEYFRVAIFSSRSSTEAGRKAMKAWLYSYAPDIADRVEWPATKPPAFLSIDDRAITFTGKWPDPRKLLAFKPWNKK